jgi:hypothetical protein
MESHRFIGFAAEIKIKTKNLNKKNVTLELSPPTII